MKKLFIFFVIFILMFSTFNITYADSNFNENNVQFQYKYQYRIGDCPLDNNGIPLWISQSSSVVWKNYSNPSSPIPDSTDKTVWIKVQLPDEENLSDEKLSDAALLFQTFDQIFEIYLDKKEIYKFGDFNNIKRNFSPGSPWHIIQLPEDYSGKTLYIRMHALNNKNNGIINNFQIESRGNILLKIVSNDMPTVILTSLFAFVGICSIFFYLYAKVGKSKRSLLYLGLSSIMLGIWLLSQTDIKQVFIYSPIFWSYTSILSLYFLPIFFSLSIKYILEHKYSVILNGITIIVSIFITLSLLMDMLHILALVLTIKYFHMLLALVAIILIYIVLRTLNTKNSVGRIFARSFALFCVLVIIDIIRWHTYVGPNFHFFCQWGMFIFVISMIFILVHQIAVNQEKINSYSKEILLKEEILNEKKKLLEDAIKYDKVKTEFFTNISHELRTPLNIIFSTIQLLELYIKKGDIITQGASLTKHMKVMKQNCYRLLRLVNNLIDITKIDSGYMKANFENFDIVSTVENITLSVADFVKSKDIDLIFDTDTEEKFMNFDCEKIERIILNLLSNAVKFSKPGSCIFVDLQDKGDTVCISVRDTGIGLPREKLESVFERFIQVDQSLTRSHEGSGIGLSLVKSLVEMHKGTINVESELGKGSKFVINVPATLEATIKKKLENSSIQATNVEKVNIEFSDIYY